MFNSLGGLEGVNRIGLKAYVYEIYPGISLLVFLIHTLTYARRPLKA